MIEWIAFGFLILGALFILVSAIGLLRLPDLYMRMHATTKTTSLGVFLLLVGSLFALPDISTIFKGLLVIIFIFLTSPLGAHMISKAGHLLNVSKSDNYIRDDMEE
jgi:multicomponent Na+:H+ antiporter subunit G